MKQIIVDFLKWDCEVRYGTSVGYEDGISKKAEDYLHQQLLQQTQCTTLREYVAQKLDYWVEADTDELGKFGNTKRGILISEYSDLLKLIDAGMPVA